MRLGSAHESLSLATFLRTGSEDTSPWKELVEQKDKLSSEDAYNIGVHHLREVLCRTHVPPDHRAESRNDSRKR